MAQPLLATAVAATALTAAALAEYFKDTGGSRDIHTTHRYTRHTNTYTAHKTPLARVTLTRFILMLATCNAYGAHSHGSESP